MKDVLSIIIAAALLAGCGKPTATSHRADTVKHRELASESQWHGAEEAKINAAVAELRRLGKWNERWDKFHRLGDYVWRANIDCDELFHDGKQHPCMSGGYNFSELAFEQLKSGDLSHDPHNTAEESFRMQQALIAKSQSRR